MRIGGQKIPIHTVLMVLFEAGLIAFSLLLAALLRFHSFAATWYYIHDRHTALRFALVALVCQVAFYYYDLYDFGIVRRRSSLVVRLLQALGLVCAAIGAIYYLDPDLSLGRGITLLAAITTLG